MQDSPCQRHKKHAEVSSFAHLNWRMPMGSWKRLLGNVHLVMSSHSGQHQLADVQFFLGLLSWRCQGHHQESPFFSCLLLNMSPVACNGILIVTSGPSSLLLISPFFTPDLPQGPSGPASSPMGMCSHQGLLHSPGLTQLDPWPLPIPGPGRCFLLLDTHTTCHTCQQPVWWRSPCYPQLTAPTLSLPCCGSILTPSAETTTARSCSWTGCSMSGTHRPNFHTSPLLLPLRLPPPSKHNFS